MIGFLADNAVKALVASLALESDMPDNIVTPNVLAGMNSLAENDGAELEEEVMTHITAELVAEEYSIEADTITDFMADKGFSAEEVAQIITEYQYATNTYITVYEPTSGNTNPEGIPAEQFMSAPFVYSSGINERINESTGSLSYDDVITKLPWVNNSDFNLTLKYNQDLAELYDRSGWVEITSEDMWWYEYRVYRMYETIMWFGNIRKKVTTRVDEVPWAAASFKTYDEANAWGLQNWQGSKFDWGFDYDGTYWETTETKKFVVSKENTFKRHYNSKSTLRGSDINPMSHLGAGWYLGFDRILINRDSNEKYVVLSSGAKYLVEGNKLKNHTLDNLTFSVEYNSSFMGSVYLLSSSDGTKEYFNSSGDLIGIIDRFFNKVTFVKNATSGEFTTDISITDVSGAVTHIKSNNNKVVFVFNDESTVTLDITSSGNFRQLQSKTDQAGRVTNYTYSKEDVTFCSFGQNASPDSNAIHAATSAFVLLKEISYPTGSKTVYNYRKLDGLQGYGKTQYFSVSERYETVNGVQYNKLQYSYSTSYTGWPYQSNSYSLAADFTYQTYVKDSQDVTTYMTFDHRHAKIEECARKDGKLLLSKKLAVFSDTLLPSTIETRKYGPNGTGSCYNHESLWYTSHGELSTSLNTFGVNPYEWPAYTPDSEVSYWYDTSYRVQTKKKTRTGSDSYATEDRVLTPDKKNIASICVYKEQYSTKELITRTDFFYDSKGRLIESRKYYSGSSYLTTLYTYNNRNLVTSITTGGITNTYAYDTMGKLLTSTDASGNMTRYEYDVLGRMTKQINPDNTFKTNVYNDIQNIITTTDENGVSIIYT